jgi:hypothetical protein
MDDKTRQLIGMLIYPVIDRVDPVSRVNYVVNIGILEDRIGFEEPKEYLEALRLALASNEPLASILQQGHSEDVIRMYLLEVKRKLEALPDSNPSQPRPKSL